jgi:uncharacterized membrane protein YphA (DoxX/SURF4 family)
VLLRVAIGWHLLYEGLYKLDTQGTDTPWSAEAYLSNATGPFAEHFHNLVEDDGKRAPIFESQALSGRWQDLLNRFADHYGLDEKQRESARQELQKLLDTANEEYFNDGQIQGIIQTYRRDRQTEDSERFLSTSEQKRLGANLGLLRERIHGLTERFQKQLDALLTDAQRERGRLPTPLRTIDVIDLLVIWGQIVGGGCLLVGLFTRLSSLGAAAMLLLFYLSMPPFPGLPATDTGMGHYLYVNENLIEALALLVLATTACGRWAGLDALVRALITRPLFGVGRKDE